MFNLTGTREARRDGRAAVLWQSRLGPREEVQGLAKAKSRVTLKMTPQTHGI